MKRLWLIFFLLLYVSCFSRPNPIPKLNIRIHRIEVRENFLSGCLSKKRALFIIGDMGELSVQSFYPNQKLYWSYNTKLHLMDMCEFYKGNYITYVYEKDGMGKYKIIGDCFYCN